MAYDFLNVFHKRMEIVAIIEFLVSKTTRKALLKESGFEEEESINLILSVLCFIMEKSLLDEPCAKEDIASFIRTLDAEYFKKGIPDENYAALTDYIIRDCLQNGGVPYYFRTLNYETGKSIEINVKLIDDKRIIAHEKKIFSYYLTPQGYKFMFNTLEIEESMQVSIEQLKLSLSIRKRNFGAARQSVDNLYNICRSQIQKIEYFIKKVKEDIGAAGIDEYEQMYNDTFSALKEQKDGYEDLYRIICDSEEALLIDDKMKTSKELTGDIDSIIYIKHKLKFIMGEQSKLLLKQQELQKIYTEAIDNILYIGFENRLDLESTLLNRIEENPGLIKAMTGILRPLFMPSPNSFYNINLAYRAQRIEAEEKITTDGNVLYDDSFFNAGESERERNIKELNEKYLDILDVIFNEVFYAENHEVTLQTIVEKYREKGISQYRRLVPKTRILLNVLLQLHNIRKVEVGRIRESQQKTVFVPSEEFDIKYCVLQLIDAGKQKISNRINVYESIVNIDILVHKDETLIIQEIPDESSNSQEFNTMEQLVCPAMIFKAEVRR